VCGDGLVRGTEQCDSGGRSSAGCSTTCTLEAGWECEGEPSVCDPACGDGLVTGDETCDDHNRTNGDGCSFGCRVERGWVCSGAPSACVSKCGDGVKVGTEACDDGNNAPSDGCSATCQIEAGFACHGLVFSFCEHSACASCEQQNCRQYADLAYLIDRPLPASELDGNELTTKILDCAYRTGCEQQGTVGFVPWDGGSNGGYTTTNGSQLCLCGGPAPLGAGDYYQCMQGTRPGPCYEIMKLGADATNPGDVVDRDYDPVYAIGRAADLLDCQEAHCAAVCP
jgi:cysteine-rich repeat protein